MKKYNSIAITLIILSMLAHSCASALAESSEPFPDEEWNRTYNVTAMDDTHWIEHTSDGGYVIIGSVNHFSNGNALSNEYIAVKTDAKGDHQWNRKFMEEDEDRGGYEMQTCIMETSDHGYLIAGSTENYKTASLNIWIRKMDAEGIELWKKDFKKDRPSRQYFGANSITGRYNEAERSVRETPDGGFLILGKTDTCRNCSNEEEHPMDIWLMKIDPKGNEEWNRTLGRTDEAAYSFQVTSDGGFVLAGTSNSNITWFKKSDRNGTELWNRTYDVIGGRSVMIRQASDGGYAAAIADPSGTQIRLIKTDPDGLKQWEKTYADSSFQYFQHTRDGGFLLWRSTFPDGRLLKVDRDGNEQWRRYSDDLIISYVEQTKEGDYLLAGTKISDDCILGAAIKKLDSGGNKLWENMLRISWPISAKRKVIAETENGYIVTGINIRNLILKKFKNGDVPFAVFTYEPEYPGMNQAVTFDASTSNDPNGDITNYIWDFGDGNITDTTGKKVTHSYDRMGESIVRLTVMNNSGGVNSTWKKVFVQKLAAPEDILNVTFGNYTSAKYAQETSDGGFIIAGRNDSIYEGWLLKTDPDGKEEWNWTFRGNELKSVIQTQDGGFMAAGDNGSDIKLVKIDQEGKEQWNKTFIHKGIGPNLMFGLVSGENGTVARTQDGGYAIAGFNRSDVVDYFNAWLVKTDPDGNESWSRILMGDRTGQNILSSVQETSDGGFIVAGTWSNPYYIDVRLIKINPEGKEEWNWNEIMNWSSENYGPIEAGPVLQTTDGGFMMMSASSHLNASAWHEPIQIGPEWSTDIWLMKTDAKGKEQWRKSNRVKSLAWEASLSATQDAGYVYSAIVQERPENDYENSDSFSVKFVKLDSEGNIEWQKRDMGYSIKPTSDGGYVTARGSSLVKLGWRKPELSLNGIMPDKTSNLNGTPIATISSIEKVSGFEAFLAITILLGLYMIWQKRR
ncbi:MAG TPA: PKD domain-containing protein [candidate division Zixibacteria bacterium]|nr:PKD domain-containing protein [candidate division Zixibacteria bacterium]